MSFASPWLLGLLLFIPLIFLLYTFQSDKHALNISLPFKNLVFANSLDRVVYHVPFVLRLCIFIILILAIARPQLGSSTVNRITNGIDIMLAIDTSQSMSALDLELDNQSVNRLTVVKSIMKDFIKRRVDDRLGLVVFANEAYIQSPMTIDHGALLDLTDYVYLGMVGRSTAIGSAIAVGTKHLKDLDSKSKVLILMTDGENTSGSIHPNDAVELAKKYKIKIYTIGIGREGEVPMVIDTKLGPKVTKQVVNIDEELLIKIAEETGGQYYRAHNTAELEKIYSRIDELEKTEKKFKEKSSFNDIFERFVTLALLLLFIEIIISNTISRRL